MNHFERLGLPRRFSLDETLLEREYLARGRSVHPDFFQTAGDLEQRASQELSAALNESYGVLRDPFRRADYLLQLEGGPTAAEFKEMPKAFLEEMLGLRMEIEELKENADQAGLESIEKQLVDRLDQTRHDIACLFEPPARLKEIRQSLNASKYLQGLIRDLQAD
jgi:molecular chaperone HscB